MVRLYHPALEAYHDVLSELVAETYRRSGWQDAVDVEEALTAEDDDGDNECPDDLDDLDDLGDYLGGGEV